MQLNCYIRICKSHLHKMAAHNQLLPCLVAAFWFILQLWGEQELRKLAMAAAATVLVEQASSNLQLSLLDTLSLFSWHLLLQHWVWQGNVWKSNPKLSSFLSSCCVPCSWFSEVSFQLEFGYLKKKPVPSLPYPSPSWPLKCFIKKYVNYTLETLCPHLKSNHSESKTRGYSQ